MLGTAEGGMVGGNRAVGAIILVFYVGLAGAGDDRT